MDPRQTLAHQLRIQFELPRDRPTDDELDVIIESVSAFEAQHNRAPTKDEWRAITLKHVRFSETPFYKGMSFQDLNALLAQLRATAPRRK